MANYVLFVCLIVTLSNSIAWGVFVSWHGFLVTACVVLFIAYKIRTFAVENAPEIIDGLDVGAGYEITNPEQPKNTHVTLDIAALNLGILTLGSPGAGKTKIATFLAAFLDQRKDVAGLAMHDGKGDFEIYRDSVVSGIDYKHFFSSELESSSTINVMSGDIDAVVDTFIQVFVGTESEYYGGAQQRALRSTVPLLMALGTCNLQDLWALLTVEACSCYALDQAQEKGVDGGIIANAQQYFDEDEKDRLKCIDGLLNKMHPYVASTLAPRLNAYAPTLDILKAVEEGENIYFHLPLSNIALDISIFTTERFGLAAKNRQLDTRGAKTRRTYALLFDDWGKFFYENFGPITARCRSAKMPINFFFQSRGQTDVVDHAKNFTTQIQDNIGTMIALRINGFDTASWVAQQFGTYETETVSFRDGEQMVSTIDKPRVKAEELRDLDAGEAFIQTLVTGEGGSISNRRLLTRFPLPEEKLAAPETWPVVDMGLENKDVDGLHYWSKFMDKDNLIEHMKSAVIDAIDLEEDSSSTLGDIGFDTSPMDDVNNKKEPTEKTSSKPKGSRKEKAVAATNKDEKLDFGFGDIDL